MKNIKQRLVTLALSSSMALGTGAISAFALEGDGECQQPPTITNTTTNSVENVGSTTDSNNQETNTNVEVKVEVDASSKDQNINAPNNQHASIENNLKDVTVEGDLTINNSITQNSYTTIVAGQNSGTIGKDDKQPGADDKQPGADDKQPGKDDKKPAAQTKKPVTTLNKVAVKTTTTTAKAKTTTAKATDNPKTGDESLAVAAVGLLGAGSMLVARRKSEN